MRKNKAGKWMLKVSGGRGGTVLNRLAWESLGDF